jgi:hypothetical protein
MRYTFTAIIAATLVTALAPAAQPAQTPATVAFTNVSVVAMDRPGSVADQTVVVR